MHECISCILKPSALLAPRFNAQVDGALTTRTEESWSLDLAALLTPYETHASCYSTNKDGNRYNPRGYTFCGGAQETKTLASATKARVSDAWKGTMLSVHTTYPYEEGPGPS